MSDTVNMLQVPTVPNSSLSSPDEKQLFGCIKLRFNEAIDFVENVAFDAKLAIYDDHYQNSQAHSVRFYEHMKSVLEKLKQQLPKNSCLVEVGCGKGDFIELVQADGYFHAIGYDVAYEGNNPSIHKCYLSSANQIKADLVVLRHVLEHIQAPHEFLAMLKNIFGAAMIYIEVPNYDWIIKNQTFFDITYEHVNYFSPIALKRLFKKTPVSAGLCFEDQYQYIIAEIDSLSENFARQYVEGVWRDLDFAQLFHTLKNKITSINNLLTGHRKAYLWGAATKGCMFLAHCANMNMLLDKINFAIDVNPAKWGKYLPGSLIPIKKKEAFFKEANGNDLLIIANPNYRQEIAQELNQQGLRNIEIICL